MVYNMRPEIFMVMNIQVVVFTVLT